MPILLALTAAFGKLCPIVEYGATTADSGQHNTAAFDAAVTACAMGGTVVVAGGAYNVGPMSLKGTQLFLQIDKGSSLVTMSGPDGWPVDKGDYKTILQFTECHGCGLVGEGTIWAKSGRPPSGFDWYYLFDQNKLKYGRPLLVHVSGCTNWTMRDVTLLDAPQFNVKLDNVQRAEIAHVNITSSWYIDPKTEAWMEPHNTDGIDPGGGSSDVHIHHVYIHNGDDSIAVKPSSPCTRNILVEHSHFEFGHGCSIGSVGKGCVENVIFRNITMKSQENGCRVKTYSDKIGYVRNITWQDITIEDTDGCLTVNANYHPPPPHPTAFINVSELFFRNVRGTGCRSPPEFVCPEDSPCRDIKLSNVELYGEPKAKDFHMNCQNAYGTASGDIQPRSCLGKA